MENMFLSFELKIVDFNFLFTIPFFNWNFLNEFFLFNSEFKRRLLNNYLDNEFFCINF
jgi:hypothetical protein